MVLATLFGGCKPPASKFIEISIGYDITESNGTNLDIEASEIIELFGIKDNPFNQARFRASTLSGVHINRINQLKLSPIESMSEYQKYVRQAEIEKFTTGIDSLITTLKNEETGRQYSSLFKPINAELLRLARSNADKKYFICFTDLQENSAIFSCYSKSSINFLKNNPEEFTHQFLKSAPLPPDLTGISIYIIYSPDILTDTNFRLISEWYKQILTRRNADVFIGANLVID